MKSLSTLFFVFICTLLSAQCPTITCVSTLTLSNCTSGQTISATSNYSSNISSRWIAPGNFNIASIGTSTSIVNINHIGTYTVEFKDNVSNCVVQDTVQVSSIVSKPKFILSLSSNTMLCTNSQNYANFLNAQTSPIPGGAVSYTLLVPGSSTLAPLITGTASSYTFATCGLYSAFVKDNSNFCLSSFSFNISCPSFTPIPLTIIGSNTVCFGTSVNFTANGSNHTWNTGANTTTINTIPMTNTTYVVSGNDMNGCASSGSITVLTYTNCSDIWPGDANSDGIVNNLDVFEIGLAFSSTGPFRSPGGNTYISQFASNWTGTVSTGKNRAHADCNGDGLVNNNDTAAISANFSLTHSFKETGTEAISPEISLVPDTVAYAGIWNKASIYLGDGANDLNQIYGAAFDVNYDQNMIQSDSVKILFTSSFLNSGNQNIVFKKPVFTNGKLYCATVRVDHTNVNGTGQIGEFWYKLKSGIPNNSILQISVTNGVRINAAGITSTLINDSASHLIVRNNLTGLNEFTSLKSSVFLFPNPAKESLCLKNSNGHLTNYLLSDLSGREIMRGEFSGIKTISLAGISSGTYMLRFESNLMQVNKKLVIE